MKYIIILSLVLFSCRTAEWHYGKFQQKGGKTKCVSDTIQVLDTLVFNGDTIYKWREKLIVKDSIYYLTKWEVKYKYKEQKQKEKTERTEKRKEEKTKQKETKQKEKTERAKLRWWIWLIIGFVLAHLLRWAYYFAGSFINIPITKR